MNNKGKKQAGVIQTALDNEVAAGCARLNIRSRKELFAEAKLHPGVEEYPEAYEFMPAPFVARVRALELLAALAHDGNRTCVEWLDEWIADLRKALRTAATTKTPEKVAREMKRRKEEIHAQDSDARLR
jgi:hypothetical protein